MIGRAKDAKFISSLKKEEIFTVPIIGPDGIRASDLTRRTRLLYALLATENLLKIPPNTKHFLKKELEKSVLKDWRSGRKRRQKLTKKK